MPHKNEKEKANMRKNIHVTVLCWATISLLATITLAQETEVAKLILSLPNAGTLPPEYRLPEGVQPMGIIPINKEKAVAQYRSNIKQLKDRFDLLKSNLKAGRSIFTYPGLMAKGRIQYWETEKKYTITLGVFDEISYSGSQGVFGPFEVFFDDSGTIMAIKDIVFKQ